MGIMLPFWESSLGEPNEGSDLPDVTGIVRAIKDGVAIIEIDGGDYTVVEVLGAPDLEVGETVCGNLESHGGEDLRTATGERVSVFVQAVHVDAIEAREFLVD